MRIKIYGCLIFFLFFSGFADEKTCVSRGCCWDQRIPAIPWCFHPNIEPVCAAVPNEKKVDCYPSGTNPKSFGVAMNCLK